MGKGFITEDFMLRSKTAKRLYHEFAEDLPIIDYHCHLQPAMIAENYQFRDTYDLFLGGDHYKWRQMRSNGVPEEYITGDADGLENGGCGAVRSRFSSAIRFTTGRILSFSAISRWTSP